MITEKLQEISIPEVDLRMRADDSVDRTRSKSVIDDFRRRASEVWSDLPSKSTELFQRAKRETSENQWLVVGAAAASALAVGLLVGRFFSRDKFVAHTEEEYPAGYDE